MKKRLFAIGCIFVFCLGLICLVASLELFRAQAIIQRNGEKIKQALHEANSIEIHFLSPTQNNSAETYTTAESRQHYFVQDKIALTSVQSKALLELLGQHIFTGQNFVGCHDPGHVLVFKRGNKELLEASFCLKCSNIEFEVYPWVGASSTILEKDGTFGKLPLLEAFLMGVRRTNRRN